MWLDIVWYVAEFVVMACSRVDLRFSGSLAREKGVQSRHVASR